MDIYEDAIVPETPKAIPNEQLFVYVPMATKDSPGIVMFDDDDFVVQPDGRVYIRWPSYQTNVSTVVIKSSDWSKTYPAEATVKLPDIRENTVVFLVPADDITRVEATNARLIVKMSQLDYETEKDSIVVVSRSEKPPVHDLAFTVLTLQGAGEEDEHGDTCYRPSVSFVGIDSGGGGFGNVDYDLVEAQIYKALEEVRSIECKVVDETLYITFDPKYNTVEVVDETLIIK